VVEAEARIRLADRAAAPGDRLGRRVHAEIAPGGAEMTRERQRQAPPAAADVEHRLVGGEARRLAQGLAQQEAGLQEIERTGGADPADGRGVRDREAGCSEEGAARFAGKRGVVAEDRGGHGLSWRIESMYGLLLKVVMRRIIHQSRATCPM
jgi:hypothetical protein